MLHFRSGSMIWIMSTILFVILYDLSNYIRCDQTYLFNDQAKSLVQGHDDQALLQSYYNLCCSKVELIKTGYLAT